MMGELCGHLLHEHSGRAPFFPLPFWVQNAHKLPGQETCVLADGPQHPTADLPDLCIQGPGVWLWTLFLALMQEKAHLAGSQKWVCPAFIYLL